MNSVLKLDPRESFTVPFIYISLLYNERGTWLDGSWLMKMFFVTDAAEASIATLISTILWTYLHILHLYIYYNKIIRVKLVYERSTDKPNPFPIVLFAGIMTLTSSPCELDNMSLFQDLKLKRRKVDSRCSSDGKKSFSLSFSFNDVYFERTSCVKNVTPHRRITKRLFIFYRLNLSNIPLSFFND